MLCNVDLYLPSPALGYDLWLVCCFFLSNKSWRSDLFIYLYLLKNNNKEEHGYTET